MYLKRQRGRGGGGGNTRNVITCVQAAGQEWQHPPVHRSKRTANSNESNQHQQQYLVQPAKTQESLNIQPSTKIWKMESDSSLATPPPPRSLDKGAYWTKDRERERERERESNGWFSLTECPRHRHQAVSPIYCVHTTASIYVQWVTELCAHRIGESKAARDNMWM